MCINVFFIPHRYLTLPLSHVLMQNFNRPSANCKFNHHLIFIGVINDGWEQWLYYYTNCIRGYKNALIDSARARRADDEICHTVFTARLGFRQGDIRDIRVFIKDCPDSVNSALHLELAEPLKLHALVMHVVEFSEEKADSAKLFWTACSEGSRRLFSQRHDMFNTLQESVGC